MHLKISQMHAARVLKGGIALTLKLKSWKGESFEKRGTYISENETTRAVGSIIYFPCYFSGVKNASSTELSTA